MPVYQIHRLKDSHRQQFRWAPHTPGVTVKNRRTTNSDLSPKELARMHFGCPFEKPSRRYKLVTCWRTKLASSAF